MDDASKNPWDQKAYDKWAGNRGEVIRRLLPGSDLGLKQLVLLALLDNIGEYYNYDEIISLITSRRVMPSVKRNSVITAASTLRHLLESTDHRIEAQKRGKNTQLRLVSSGSNAGSFGQIVTPVTRRQTEMAEGPAPPSRMARGSVSVKVDPPLVTSRRLARTLVEDKELPVYGLYALSGGARAWLNASREELHGSYKQAVKRPEFEATAWGELGLREWVYGQVYPKQLGLLGLAVGEGFGELRLLQTLLAELPSDGRLDYLAVDLSPVLLLAHLHTVRELLSDALKTGRLRVAAVLGDMYSPERPLAKARALFSDHGGEFLPDNVPLVCTCFGNVVGNQTEPGRETEFFTRLKKKLPHRPLGVLVGVSLWSRQESNVAPNETSKSGDGKAGGDAGDVSPPVPKPHSFEDASWCDLLGATPRHLLTVSGDLVYEEDAAGVSGEEFVGSTITAFTTTPGALKKSTLDVPLGSFWVRNIQAAQGKFEVEYDVQRFYYRVRRGLRLAKKGTGKTRSDESIPSGTDLLLGVVYRYDPETLARAVKNKGFRVTWRSDRSAERTHSPGSPRPAWMKVQVGPDEVRLYTVLSAWLPH